MRGKYNSMDINIFEIQQGKCCQVPGHWEKRVFPDFNSILFLRTDCSPQLHFRKLFPFPPLSLPFQKSLGECMPSEYHFQLAFFSYNGENLDATFNNSVSLRLEWWGYFCLYNSLKKKKSELANNLMYTLSIQPILFNHTHLGHIRQLWELPFVPSSLFA